MIPTYTRKWRHFESLDGWIDIFLIQKISHTTLPTSHSVSLLFTYLSKSCSGFKDKKWNLSDFPWWRTRIATLHVTCDMSDKGKVGVTVISHDSENRTLVDGYEAGESYSRIIQRSEHLSASESHQRSPTAWAVYQVRVPRFYNAWCFLGVTWVNRNELSGRSSSWSR